jgi:protein-tyrosine phosphatase
MPDVLAGMSMPFLHPERRMRGGGALKEFNDELHLLSRAGIRGVVSLLNIPTDAKLYSDAGFEFICLPVADGQPPSLRQVSEFVLFVDACREQGKAVAAHCEAGCGRTGTMLCAYLIAKGDMPENAIKRVRAAEPSAVETRAQINFLSQLPQTLPGTVKTTQ